MRGSGLATSGTAYCVVGDYADMADPRITQIAQILMVTGVSGHAFAVVASRIRRCSSLLLLARAHGRHPAVDLSDRREADAAVRTRLGDEEEFVEPRGTRKSSRAVGDGAIEWADDAAVRVRLRRARTRR